MPDLKVLAVHGCCRGDDPSSRVIEEVVRSTRSALAWAGYSSEVRAPFYGSLLNAYARGDISVFAPKSTLEGETTPEQVRQLLESSVEPANMGVGIRAMSSMYDSIRREMTPAVELEWRLPVPDAVREWAIHRFTTDVATYLSMLRAKRAIWQVVADSWKEFGESGPDLVVAHSLGSVVVWDVIAEHLGNTSENGDRNLLMMGSPLYLSDAKRGIAQPPSTSLGMRRWMHIYDDGDIVAGGRPLGAEYNGVENRQVENKSFPTSHSYPAYVQAAAEEGVFHVLLA